MASESFVMGDRIVSTVTWPPHVIPLGAVGTIIGTSSIDGRPGAIKIRWEKCDAYCDKSDTEVFCDHDPCTLIGVSCHSYIAKFERPEIDQGYHFDPDERFKLILK